MNETLLLRLWAVGWLAVSVPLLVLAFGLDVDVSFSPAWQVVFLYLSLVSVVLMWWGLSVYLLFPRVDRWGWSALGLWVVVAGLVLALGLWLEGSVPGFRSPRLGDMLALFACLAPVVVALCRVALRRSWRGVLGPAS